MKSKSFISELTPLLKHSIKTAKDVITTEGYMTLVRKFFRYYFGSLLLAPYIVWKSKKFTNKTPIPKLVDFILADNYGVLHAGQVRSEITDFLTIAKSIKPKVIVEIGTATGGTLFALSRMLSPDGKLISIDLPYGEFGGGYHVWKVPFYKTFATGKQEIHLLRLNSHLKSTVQSLEEILKDTEIDILFIDGDHSYEGVKKDFEMYSPFVKKGGIIAFHDIANNNRVDGCDVDLYWAEIKKKYKNKEIIGKDNIGWGGIGVLYNK